MPSQDRRRCGRAYSSMAWASLALAASTVSIGRITFACDVCAIYTATEMRESRQGIFAGVAEQFTGYDTLQDDGHKVANPAGERLNSSITQFIGGYTFTPWLSAQINLPLITRQFRRQETQGIVDGDETGIGDMSLLAAGVPFSWVTENSVARWSAILGVKLPTGSPRRLKEELPTSQVGDGSSDPFNGHPPPQALKYHNTQPGEVQSGIHGHDLALGSGSTDVVLGTQLFTSWRRLYLNGGVQYAIRTGGSFGYQYANDLTWNGGPGVFGVLEHDFTVGLQGVISGESKGKDTLGGVSQDDTARTGVYAGPQLDFTWGTSLGAELGVDLSVVQNNSALQIVPDYRLRGGFTWRF
jgi:hypothetical protein